MGLLNDSLKRTRAGIGVQRSFRTVLGKITLRVGSSITLLDLLALLRGDKDVKPSDKELEPGDQPAHETTKRSAASRATKRRTSSTG